MPRLEGYGFERFGRVSVDWFLRLIGAALLACVVADAAGGTWRVHAGELFPWRHLPILPLYSSALLVVEWAIGAGAGALLLAGVRRTLAVRAGLVATAMGISQRFSNHRSLLLIVLAFVALGPPCFDEDAFEARPRPNLALVRAQLIVVYTFSVMNKVAHGFFAGDALTSLFGWTPGLARALAVGVIAGEILTPLLLLWRPTLGIAAAVVLHLAMALLLPNVWPFSLTMVAMALLFAVPPTSDVREPGGPASRGSGDRAEPAAPPPSRSPVAG
jgi:hypothetical protein